MCMLNSMQIQKCDRCDLFSCRVDFHTQEYDPSAKDSHEDSRQLQEAVAQIFNVNGTHSNPLLLAYMQGLVRLWIASECCLLRQPAVSSAPRRCLGS